MNLAITAWGSHSNQMARNRCTSSREIEPQDIFGAAYGHLYFARHALKTYYKDRGRLPNIISPLATYSSLSLELFLKALVFQTTGRPAEYEHDLLNLWNKLDENHRKAMVELIGLPSDELDASLVHHRDMFRTARYNYESNNVRYNISFLANLAEVAGHYFVKIMPKELERPLAVEFYFHSVSPDGKLNRHTIRDNIALYKTFPSLHNHYIQQSIQIRLTPVGGDRFTVSIG